jgi:transposase-like protein
LNCALMTLDGFQQQFSTEEVCAEYLFQAKWPDGFSCPLCGHRHAYKTGTRRLPLYQCRHCRYQSSLTAGTVMEGSRTGLRKWFTAFYLVSRTDSGISAVRLSSIIQVTYKTAWLILHKIRHAMSLADGETLLSGVVRVNTASYGKPHNPTVNWHKKEQPFLVGSSLDDQGEPAYIKMKLIPDSHMRQRLVTPTGTQQFTERHIEPLSTDIQFVTGRFSPKRFHRLLLLASQAAIWINATFHGLGRRHLQAYLDEFGFRRNLSLRHGPIFSQLARLCAASPSIIYSVLTNKRLIKS